MKEHCDIETGRIYNCEKGSFKWWHEKGHIVFNESPETSWILMLKSYCFDFWIFSVTVAMVFSAFYPAVVIFWGTYFLLTIYEEHWCNQYAKIKTQRYIKDDNMLFK